MIDLILASASPRRQQMLRDLGLAFTIVSPDIDERRLRGEPPLVYVQRLSRQKAESAAARAHRAADTDWALLAADTIVVDGKSVLGKPADADEAVRMLRKLSGRTHEVITGYIWLGVAGGVAKTITGYARTKVTFAEMPADFWKWYVSTGEPMDKAGAYAAQGIGTSFIERVHGSYSNVVGLPLSHALASFKKAFNGEIRERCRRA